MKNIKIALWATPAVLTLLWLAATLPFAEELGFFTVRNYLVQYSGVIATGVMSLGMILAIRLGWIEGWLNGLDKSYRLHKWLGIMALVTSIIHWLASEFPKWMVGLGWLQRPRRGPRPGGATELSELQQFFNSQRGLAEVIGEWAFYAAVVLIALALIKRFPYKYFVSTHMLISVAYLAVVIHSVPLLTYDDWATPIGVLSALLMIGGTYAALLSLTRRIGRRNQIKGTIEHIRNFPELRATEIVLALEDKWQGHHAGQFAFATFDKREGKHPFTIASAWDKETKAITFITKGLGDYTNFLPEKLKTGNEVIVEGPYGRFTFDDDKDRQIWIGGGIGITPFIARMKQLAKTSNRKTIDLIHSTKEMSPEALDLLKADAENAGINLHVMVDDRDGFLTGDLLRKMVPEWQSASFWFCGPAGFGQALRNDLLKQGLAAAEFKQELFNMR
ncbi:MAG: ferredoxin reductase family protein [Cognatishimia sp.]